MLTQADLRGPDGPAMSRKPRRPPAVVDDRADRPRAARRDDRGNPPPPRAASPPRGGGREDRDNPPRTGWDRRGQSRGSPPRGGRANDDGAAMRRGRGAGQTEERRTLTPPRGGRGAGLTDDRRTGTNSPATAPRSRAAALARSATSVTATDSPRQRPLKPVCSSSSSKGKKR